VKITLSKKQWESIGKKAGWTKTAQNFAPKMMPGQTPYTDQEQQQLSQMIGDAANSDMGEGSEDLMRQEAMPWDDIPDELIKIVADIARSQGELVRTKKDAYDYAIQDEDALDILLPYLDM